jgi:hypothetical protein
MLYFFKFCRKIWRTKLAFWAQAKGNFAEKVIITLVSEKNAIFSLKLAKIAENCDHNIGHRRFVNKIANFFKSPKIEPY